MGVARDTVRKTPVQARLPFPAPSLYLTLRMALRRLRAAMLGGKTDTGEGVRCPMTVGPEKAVP